MRYCLSAIKVSIIIHRTRVIEIYIFRMHYSCDKIVHASVQMLPKLNSIFHRSSKIAYTKNRIYYNLNINYYYYCNIYIFSNLKVLKE